ncbi:MAG: endonuclease [Bacteroidetes bacterium]|nr:endonuclease [Bacteroidota bacterium]
MNLKSLISFLLVTHLCFSQTIPSGYYNSATGLTGTPLKLALHNIIDNHTSVSYNSLHTHFKNTDKKSNGKVWDIYSDVPNGTPPYSYSFISADQCGSYAGEGDCYNREHAWPQSWFNSATPMESDLFHIYPTDGYVNAQHGNYPFGEVANGLWTSQNGCKLGFCSFPGYTNIVFEPIDEYKGDIARSYFYMSTRYYTEDNSWSSSAMTTKASLNQWAVNLLLKWHHQDPVSTKEINRNDAIYVIQDNRNPFIDHPEWADSIWNSTLYLEVENVLNIREAIIISPNPSNGEFTFSLPQNIDSSIKIEVLNSIGQEIKNYTFSKNGDLYKINLEKNISGGLYNLNIFTSNQQYFAKLLIE